MARLVADSSALILLSKCTRLKIVCELFEVIVPSSVSAEVASQDLMEEYPDAALISDLISKGMIKVQSPSTTSLSLPISLHRGEKDALLLTIEVQASLFAIDDGKAIKASRFLKVPFVITPKIVVELFKLEKISFTKARESLEKLGKIGRYSPEIIAEALIGLMEGKNGKTDNHKDT